MPQESYESNAVLRLCHRRLVVANLTVLSERRTSPVGQGWFRQGSENTGIVSVIPTITGALKVPSCSADIPAMLSPTLQFDVTPTQQQLLHAYQAQAATLKVTTEEFDGWLERIDELSGVDVDQLTGLHGQLIASGMLKFEISGRNVGLRYQLSQQGKKAIEVKTATDEEDLESENVASESPTETVALEQVEPDAGDSGDEATPDEATDKVSKAISSESSEQTVQDDVESVASEAA